jgi:hypothetical protein
MAHFRRVRLKAELDSEMREADISSSPAGASQVCCDVGSDQFLKLLRDSFSELECCLVPSFIVLPGSGRPSEVLCSSLKRLPESTEGKLKVVCGSRRKHGC